MIKSLGQVGWDFEKESIDLLKALFNTEKVFKIDHPVDFLVMDYNNKFYFVECKATKSKKANNYCTKPQMKYATHFLVKEREAVKLLSKEEYVKQYYQNKFLLSSFLSPTEKIYLKRFCKKLVFLLIHLQLGAKKQKGVKKK